jgi:ABC-type sugar transport system substrate-binding protein
MKRISILLFVFVLITGSVFAGGKGQVAGEKQKHLVFISPIFANEVWNLSKKGFEDAAKQFNFRGDWVGPTGIDVDEMIKQIEVAIAEKVDGIVTMGMNPQAMVPVLKKADAAGIPVVVVNSDIPDAPRLAYLGTDPINLGTIGAEAIVKKLNGKAPKVVYCVTALDYLIGMQQVDSYRKTLSKLPGYEEKAIIEGKSDLVAHISKWQTVFDTYPDANVAIAVTADAGIAAARIVTENGLQNKVTIMAIDDWAETLDGIRKGVIYGTMTQNFYRKGYQAGQWLMEYINTGKKPANLLNDSGTMLVTKENVETYQVDMEKPETWN